jgi:DNA-binding IclR family transcriptional regulator
MPHFFFDVRENEKLAPRDSGAEFADAEAAEIEAVRAAVEITADGYERGTRSVSVEVWDERGKLVVTVSMSLIVKHHA